MDVVELFFSPRPPPSDDVRLFGIDAEGGVVGVPGERVDLRVLLGLLEAVPLVLDGLQGLLLLAEEALVDLPEEEQDPEGGACNGRVVCSIRYIKERSVEILP